MRSPPNFSKGERLLIGGQLHEYCGCFEPVDAGPDAPYSLKFETVPGGAPLAMTDQEFQAAYCNGRIRWLKPFERISDRAPEEGDGDLLRTRVRRLYCEAFDATPTAKSIRALGEFIERTAPTIGFAHRPPAPGTLITWLRERGEKGDRRARFMRDRFRRGPGGMRVDGVVQKVLAEKAEAYFDGFQVNQHAVYCDTRVAILEINKERAEAGLPPLKPPSKATVHRYLWRHLDYGRAKRRWGERVGGSQFKPIKGSMVVKRILETALMDHTPVDCAVVDDEQFVSIGRPYLTLMIDACSRYPLGFYLGFEPPSVYSLMACLRHAVRPKLEVARDYPDIEGEWVGFGVPETIVVDNGWEFRSSSFVDACADANISITYAAIANPEYKAIVERVFGTLRQRLFERIPGGLPFTPQQRKKIGIDPIHDAVLTLSDLKRLVYQCVIEGYGRDFHKGIKAAPEQVWRKQAAAHGTRYALDLASIDQSLTRVAAEHTLDRSGVTMFGLTYRAIEPLAQLLADLLPRQERRSVRWGSAKVKVKYRPDDLSEIYVWNEVRQAYVTLPCTMPEYSAGLSEHQHKTIEERRKSEHAKFRTEDDYCRARVRLQDGVRARMPVSKIGQRRADQRLLSKPVSLAPGDQVVVTEVNPAGPGIPMDGLANRKGAAKPRPAPLYKKAERRRSAQNQDRLPTAPPAPAAVLTASVDAFADIDFGQLQDEARRSLGSES